MGPCGESRSRCKSDDCAGGFKFLNVDPIALKLLYSVISSSFLLLWGGSSEIVAHMTTLLSWATPISGVLSTEQRFFYFPWTPSAILPTSYGREPCVVKYFFTVFRPYIKIELFIGLLTTIIALTIE